VLVGEVFGRTAVDAAADQAAHERRLHERPAVSSVSYKFIVGRGGDAWPLCCEPGSSLFGRLGNGVESAMFARRPGDIGHTR
jgi:hypothetical protein